MSKADPAQLRAVLQDLLLELDDAAWPALRAWCRDRTRLTLEFFPEVLLPWCASLDGSYSFRPRLFFPRTPGAEAWTSPTPRWAVRRLQSPDDVLVSGTTTHAAITAASSSSSLLLGPDMGPSIHSVEVAAARRDADKAAKDAGWVLYEDLFP